MAKKRFYYFSRIVLVLSIIIIILHVLFTYIFPSIFSSRSLLENVLLHIITLIGIIGSVGIIKGYDWGRKLFIVLFGLAILHGLITCTYMIINLIHEIIEEMETSKLAIIYYIDIIIMWPIIMYVQLELLYHCFKYCKKYKIVN